jgi:hypothetical protein
MNALGWLAHGKGRGKRLHKGRNDDSPPPPPPRPDGQHQQGLVGACAHQPPRRGQHLLFHEIESGGCKHPIFGLQRARLPFTERCLSIPTQGMRRG